MHFLIRMSDSELILSRNLTNPFESSTNILRKVQTFPNSEKGTLCDSSRMNE